MIANKVKYNKRNYFITTSNFDNSFKGALAYINGKALIIINNSLSKIEQQREFHKLVKNKKLSKGLN